VPTGVTKPDFVRSLFIEEESASDEDNSPAEEKRGEMSEEYSSSSKSPPPTRRGNLFWDARSRPMRGDSSTV